jgi:hypothetical protein
MDPAGASPSVEGGGEDDRTEMRYGWIQVPEKKIIFSTSAAAVCILL